MFSTPHAGRDDHSSIDAHHTDVASAPKPLGDQRWRDIQITLVAEALTSPSPKTGRDDHPEFDTPERDRRLDPQAASQDH